MYIIILEFCNKYLAIATNKTKNTADLVVFMSTLIAKFYRITIENAN